MYYTNAQSFGARATGNLKHGEFQTERESVSTRNN